MKIIINESQLRMIVENEEYINSIKELINTFDETNIDMAFQIMKGMKIKQSVILDEYKELFEIFKLKPSKLNLIKIGSRKEVDIEDRSSVPDILFKMPNLRKIYIVVENLDNLKSFDGSMIIKSKRIPNLTYVGGQLTIYGGVESLPMLKKVGGSLSIINSRIESLPMLEYVGGYLALTNINKIKSLPKLEYVGSDLKLAYTQIKSLPMLEYVGGDLFLNDTPLSKTIQKMNKSNTTWKLTNLNHINVKGKIFFL